VAVMTLYPRLAADGRRVLCGRDGCGFLLGFRHLTDFGWLLAVRPGFRREAGDVFRMTPAAVERLRAGHAPRRVGRTFKWTDGTKEWPEPCCLPVSVRCPKCALVQPAEPERLSVETLPHPGSHHLDSEWRMSEDELAIVSMLNPRDGARAKQRRRSGPRML
jgi:hypothetical protein